MPIATKVSPKGSHSANALPHIVTQDPHRGSPAPKFEVEKHRGRSLSPVRARSDAQAGPPAPLPRPQSSAAAVPVTAAKYVAPPLTWRTAAQDARAGIYYTKDDFPSSSFLPPPFSREPVQVQAGERVELLVEVDEWSVRVRVLRTGKVGLIPAWNTEGALDRLTRLNTAFNEAATCPAEARALRRRFSESSAMHTSTSSPAPSPSAPALEPAPITHIHARCIPFAARVRYGDHYAHPGAHDDDEDSSDSDSERSGSASPPSPSPAPAVYRTPARTLERGALTAADARAGSGARKSVVFPQEERPQVVFRYPSEGLVGAFLGEGEGRREDDDEDEDAREDEEWWWQGWEEPVEELEAELDAREGDERDAEEGGKRRRKRSLDAWVMQSQRVMASIASEAVGVAPRASLHLYFYTSDLDANATNSVDYYYSDQL
ncbi:hypothetical protein BD413DRAFT_614080 [Trametes elegans]|nr:hypothetical protein BD413DRAFT_614080 [Trametes elegans]